MPDTPPTIADLDHAATTRVRPEVVEAMAPFARERYGNPSGSHARARDAVRALDEARERIAHLVGCAPGEVVLTSGGTESDNHAIAGGMPPRPGVPVCTEVEHHAVLDVVEALDGCTVAVDATGAVDIEDLARVLDVLGDRVSVVSVMLANNEVGTINDLAAVARLIATHEPDVPRVALHTDAVQAAAWLDLRDHARPAQLVSISAHKLGGPKGVGALVVRRPTHLDPLLRGGGQERDRRSGTVHVAGAVGLATALELVDAERADTNARVARLRDRLADGLVATVPGLVETVPDRSRTLPGACHVCIEGVDSEALLFLLDAEGVLASAGSSCASGAQDLSHVLAAMGVPASRARGALRLSLGHDSTDADVDLALRVVPAAVERLRSFSSSGRSTTAPTDGVVRS